MKSIMHSMTAGFFLLALIGAAWADTITIEAIAAEEAPVQVAQEEDAPPPRIRIFGRKPAPDESPADKPKDDTTKKDEEEPAPRPPAPPVDPEIIKLFLQDGSVVTGKLGVKEIHVETQFGKLTIPVVNILSMRPGLDSLPELGKKINALIDALGAADFNEREAAQKELIRMGSPIRKLLEARLKQENDAERIRRIKDNILPQFEETGFDEDEENKDSAEWINMDTVVTTDFTVVGRIVEKKFIVASKFGELTVNLADVKRGERDMMAKEDIRRVVSVDGSSIAQRTWKNTKIRVEAGDRVRITADGSITMTPWGSNAISGPDGSPNYGLYRGADMPAGVLVGRIGDGGPEFKVGSKSTFVAKKAGTLYLAIGMNPSYANQAFPGKYEAKIIVQPR